MVYVPGFSPALMAEDTGGPLRVALPLGVQPTAPAVMTTTGVQPTAPPIMSQPASGNADWRVPRVPTGTQLSTVTPEIAELYPDAYGLETTESRATPNRFGTAIARRADDERLGPNAVFTQTGYAPEGMINLDGRAGVIFSTNSTRPADVRGGDPRGFVALDPNTQYRLINQRTGEIVASGLGEQGLRSAREQARILSESGGRQADWALETMAPNGEWTLAARDRPGQSPLGMIADIALPVAGAFLLPGVGGALGGALGAGLGAAGGSALSSVAQGRSLGDTLLRAGLSGIAAGGLSAVGGAPFIGGASGGASGVGGALGGSLAAAGPAAQAALNATGMGVGNILVTGGLGAGLGATAGGAIGAGLGSAAGSALGATGTGGGQPTAPRPPQQPPVQPEGNIVVTGTPQTPGFNIVTGALPGLGAGLPAVIPAETIGNPIDVVRPRPVQEEFDAVFSPPPVVPPASPSVTETIGNPITVTADPNAPAAIDAATAEAIARGLLPMGGILPSGQTPTGGETTLETDRGILDRLGDRLGNLSLSEYLRLAGVALPLLDGIGGGGRRGGLNTIPAGMFGGSGVFGGSLPRPTLPGASTGFAPRSPSTLRPQTTQDWYRYGYGPEQSFFSDVPEGEENKSQAYTGYALGGMAGGGMRGMPRDGFAVHGPGTGRSDEIPAMLSDGEYVIDAETVALLGDGSSKAGADRLDQFRANVRKHKGRHLAKGDFSVDAKRPEHYLKGGRA